MDIYESALIGDYSKPIYLDESQEAKGRDDYMRGVYQNDHDSASYYYGFRSGHSHYLRIKREAA